MSGDDFTTPAENWKPIPGWSAYEVSDLGRVWTYWTYAYRGKGGGRGKHSIIGSAPRLMSPGVRRDSGRVSVILSDGEGGWKGFTVARLVLEVFVGPCPEGMEACHWPDTNPSNNRLDNLRWDTRSENARDTLRSGRNAKVILTDDDVRVIWGRLQSGESARSLSRHYSVDRTAISRIARQESWTHITEHLPDYIRGLRKPDRSGGPICPDPDILVDAEREELWRMIPGWPTHEVSSRGRVRSGDRLLKSRPQDRGRLIVELWGNCAHRTARVHRLVLEAFVGPCPPGLEGCHNDGNPANNNLSNLRWDTRSANHHDSARHGRLNRAKLNVSSVQEIRRLFEAGSSYEAIAVHYDVTPRTIRYVCERRSWVFV